MDSNDQELSEGDFIQENYRKNPFPFWFWLFIIVVIMTMLFGMQSLYRIYIDQSMEQSPFLRVTNRQFSLFLWQHPEYMRANAKTKTGYLTGFNYLEGVNIEEGFADKYVVAPPELLFRYHTWDRLVRGEFIQREINPDEFLEFLKKVPEWKPANWKNAPKAYTDMVAVLPFPNQDLEKLPESTLPLDVRMAFIGWKNFFKEGDQINKVDPTYQELDQFLITSPHYARNYWRNVVSLDYLKSTSVDSAVLSGKVARDELAPFLKVALFNAKKDH